MYGPPGVQWASHPPDRVPACEAPAVILCTNVAVCNARRSRQD